MTSSAKALERVRAQICEVIAGSSVPEDPGHSTNTLEWLLKLEPSADEALQLAALGHDIDRAVEASKVLRASFSAYDDFKAAHAMHSAEMLLEILQRCGVEDPALADELYRLVCLHEVGGDERSDLLMDADSLSYFDVNLPLYRERNSCEETLRRCVWGYRRLSKRAKVMAAQLHPPGSALAALMEEARIGAAE
ncbi:MAG: DUF4202 family protein [Myxococcota bacterium]